VEQALLVAPAVFCHRWFSLANLPEPFLFPGDSHGFRCPGSCQPHQPRLIPRPTSESGKATSSLNALKTGLTGRTVLLPAGDAALYEAHLARFQQRYQPVGDQELALVQSLADTH
jgi:hypothetical protein